MSSILSDALGFFKSVGKTGFQLGKGFVVDENGNVIPQSDISGAKVGYPSNVVNTIQNTRTVTQRISPNLAIATAGTAGTATIVYATATNPGVQQTAQSFSSGFNSLASGFGNITNTVANNPLILIGILALGAIVILKK